MKKPIIAASLAVISTLTASFSALSARAQDVSWPPTGMQAVSVIQVADPRFTDSLFKALPDWKSDFNAIRTTEPRPWPGQGLYVGKIAEQGTSNVFLVMLSARLLCDQNSCPWAVIVADGKSTKPIWQGHACDQTAFVARTADARTLRICDTVIAPFDPAPSPIKPLK